MGRYKHTLISARLQKNSLTLFKPSDRFSYAFLTSDVSELHIFPNKSNEKLVGLHAASSTFNHLFIDLHHVLSFNRPRATESVPLFAIPSPK